MPNSKPTEPETYLCTTIRLDENNTYFVTGFDPKATTHKSLRIHQNTTITPCRLRWGPRTICCCLDVRSPDRERSSSAAARWAESWRGPSRYPVVTRKILRTISLNKPDTALSSYLVSHDTLNCTPLCSAS